jgi:hypothetical protein
MQHDWSSERNAVVSASLPGRVSQAAWMCCIHQTCAGAARGEVGSPALAFSTDSDDTQLVIQEQLAMQVAVRMIWDRNLFS